MIDGLIAHHIERSTKGYPIYGEDSSRKIEINKSVYGAKLEFGGAKWKKGKAT